MSVTIHPLLKSAGYKPRNGKVKQCKHCGKDFYRAPSRAIQPYCSPQCASEVRKVNKPLLCQVCGKEFYCSVSQQSLRNRKHCSRACVAKSRETLEVGVVITNKKRTGLMAKAQKQVNLYVRLRDCGGKDGGTNCVSCNVWKPFAEMDGGHFIPVPSSAVRFDDRNINAQCRRCNRYLRGNVRHYLKGMLQKYGQDVVDELEALEFKTHKWTAEALLEIIEKYKELSQPYLIEHYNNMLDRHDKLE